MLLTGRMADFPLAHLSNPMHLILRNIIKSLVQKYVEKNEFQPIDQVFDWNGKQANTQVFQIIIRYDRFLQARAG